MRSLITLSALCFGSVVLTTGCTGELGFSGSDLGSTPPSVTLVDYDAGMGDPPASDAAPPPPPTPPPPGCMPACGARQCGDDGCGGSCGSCTGGSSCTSAGVCQAPPPPPPSSPNCPPTGPTGREVGQIAPDFSLPLAGGSSTSIRAMCANPVQFVYRYSESCGICRAFLERDANRIYDELHAQGFEMLVVVGTARRADGSYGTPSAADAIRIRDAFGLHMPVAYEPGNEFLRNLYYSGAGVGLLMSEGNVVAAPLGRVSESTLRAAVAAHGS